MAFIDLLEQAVNRDVANRDLTPPGRANPLRTEALPSIEKVEAQIQARPQPFEGVKKQLTTPFSTVDKFIPGKRPIQLGLSILGEVSSRVQAAAVNPLLAGLTGGSVSDVVGETIQGAFGGIAGIPSRRGKIQDIFDAGDVAENFPVKVPFTNVNITKPLTQLASFTGEVALMNTAMSGQLISGAKKAKAIYETQRGAILKGSEQKFLRLGQLFKEGVDDVMGGVKDGFRKFFKNVNDNFIKADDSIVIADDIMPLLKDSAIKNFNKIVGKRGRVILDKSKDVRNIKEVKAIRDLIHKAINPKAWKGDVDAESRVLMQAYKETGRIIANNTGSLKLRKAYLNLNEEFHKLSSFQEKIHAITTKGKGFEKGIQGIKGKGMAGELKILREFGDEYFKSGEKVLKQVDRLNKRDLINKSLLRLGETAGGFAILNQIIGRQTGKISGSVSGGGSSSGGQNN